LGLTASKSLRPPRGEGAAMVHDTLDKGIE
jgi:hypothetical protein